MKTYIIESMTNHGTMVHIVNADTAKEAKKIAEDAKAWPDCTVYEIDTTTKGLVLLKPC